MIFKSFFDGGNQADSREYDVLSLATVSGKTDQWKRFENDWNEFLRIQDAPPLHTTDAVTGNGEFSRTKGWNKDRRELFLSECVDVIEKHLIRPPGKRHGLIPYVFSLVLKDFVEFSAANPDLISNDASEVCSTQAVTRVVLQGRKIGANFFHLVFDQNEPFIKHVRQRQRNKVAQRFLEPVTERITSVTESDMRVTPALQLADIFAWSYSHKLRPKKYPWQDRLLAHRAWTDDWYDKAKLQAMVDPEHFPEVKKWNLKRKPTR